MNKSDIKNFAVSEKQIGKQVKSDSPKVSVIIPAYNSSEMIGETLDSVFAQTFTDYEVVLVNDGSPDTAKFEKNIEAYLDKIVYIKQENKGAGAARNLAIENARGELLAFLDSDDIWLPEYLETQVKFLENKNFDSVYADAVWFGGSAIDGKTFMQTCPSNGKVDTDSLLKQTCNVLTSATVVRRSAVLKAGMFENEKVRAHDFVLWLKMSQKDFQIGYQKKVLLKHRIHIDSLSGNSIQRVQREINVYRRVKKLLEFDENQKQIIEQQIERLQAEKELERGKSFLLQEKFSSAVESFEKANEVRRSKKLGAVIHFLKFFPKIFLRIYRLLRAKEIAFIPKTEAH